MHIDVDTGKNIGLQQVAKEFTAEDISDIKTVYPAAFS